MMIDDVNRWDRLSTEVLILLALYLVVMILLNLTAGFIGYNDKYFEIFDAIGLVSSIFLVYAIHKFAHTRTAIWRGLVIAAAFIFAASETNRVVYIIWYHSYHSTVVIVFRVMCLVSHIALALFMYNFIIKVIRLVRASGLEPILLINEDEV